MKSEWVNLDKGIRARQHPTRRHGAKPDLYYVLRYRVDGKAKQEALGWSSEGWTLAKARIELVKLYEAKTLGKGEVTLQEKRDKAKANRIAEKQKATVAHLWKTYQDVKGTAYSRYVTDRANFRHFNHFENRLPESLRTHEINAVAKKMQEEGKAPQTIKNTLELLRRLINFGVKQDLCDRPARLHFEMPKVDNERTECLTAEQITRLLHVLDADHDQNLAAMMRLALATGMRKGALLGLRWEDINFEQGFIVLQGKQAKNGKTLTIPMTQLSRNILENIEPQRSAYLFPGKNGQKRVNINRFLVRIRHEANLPPDFRPLHGLRHTYASMLASSGKVDLFALQKLLTHSSPQMTQRYAHLADEAIKRAANVINECMDIAVNAAPPASQDEHGAKVFEFESKVAVKKG